MRDIKGYLSLTIVLLMMASVFMIPRAQEPNWQYNTWGPDTCECLIEYKWDANLPPDQIVSVVSRVVNKCPYHQGLTEITDIWTQVLEQNRRKNISIEKIRINLNVDYEVLFNTYFRGFYYTGYDYQRVLHIRLANLNAAKITVAQRIVDDYFGTGRVVVEVWVEDG